MRELPTTLYKYFSPEKMSVLESMEIYFSRPTQFNDTFDSHFLVPSEQGSGGIAGRFKFKNRLGIFCLTETATNHLMWVHYAKNHTGFVLGFDARASFFSENGRTLDKVKYRARPKVLNEPDDKACFLKSVEWQYEKEWRCVKTFESSESRLLAIAPTLVTEVILGSQMQSWQIARILEYTQAYGMLPQYFLSRPSHKTWTMEKIRKAVKLCEDCGGEGYHVGDPHE